MSTYFPMSNLRDRLAGSSSETPVLQGNMMAYMNNVVDPIASDSNISQQEVLLNFGSSRALDNQLNAWKDGRNEMLIMHPNMPQSQGLSLSLGTNVQSVMQMPPIPYQRDNQDFNMSFENEHGYQAKQTRDNEYMLSSVPNAANDIPAYGMSSIARAVPNSKYLKATQQLLDEVVNVKKAMKGQNGKKELVKESSEVEGEVRDGGSNPSSATKLSGNMSRSELSMAEKQELQNKITKLLSMLDEVDRRYRQYYHQMQIVVSSFDLIAGSGAAKPYTSLALQTISRQFRCLRDAINNQIRIARKSLGEDDASSNDKAGVGISRLRYVDQQIRQQRALQQLGMMHQHSWRPQRGLPETSVSILRAWLFEHFLHPYPKDSDKIMLARQTGLTRSQVSNWFINARVRLWKPMVEEMYKEETCDADIDSNSSSEKTTMKASKDKGEEDPQQGTSMTSTRLPMDSKSDQHQMTNVEMLGSEDGTREAQKQTNDTSFLPDERFIAEAYHVSELERFGSVGGVSLTLGLQQCEGGRLTLADNTGDHGFMPLREADVYGMGNEAADFECMDSGNRTHQFVSSLLPSFT